VVIFGTREKVAL